MRLKEESMYGLPPLSPPPKKKKWLFLRGGHCRELAVSGGSTVF